jgi:putative hydrolase of the HAD superfamily
MTKGDLEEQGGKVERSGLKHYFSAIEIVPRKNTLAYHSVATRHALPRHASWMIGNSPRSDINPALAAGLNAVFVPHPGTSIFEQDTLAAPSGNCKLLQLQTFAELKQYF